MPAYSHSVALSGERRFLPDEYFEGDRSNDNMERKVNGFRFVDCDCRSGYCRCFSGLHTPTQPLIIASDGGLRFSGTPNALASIGVFVSGGSRFNVSELMPPDTYYPTSQRAELTAAVRALNTAMKIRADGWLPALKAVVLKTDSLSITKAMSYSITHWRSNEYMTRNGHPVVDRDLFWQLEEAVIGLHCQYGIETSFWWVPRKYNADADRLAGAPLKEDFRRRTALLAAKTVDRHAKRKRASEDDIEESVAKRKRGSEGDIEESVAKRVRAHPRRRPAPAPNQDLHAFKVPSPHTLPVQHIAPQPAYEHSPPASPALPPPVPNPHFQTQVSQMSSPPPVPGQYPRPQVVQMPPPSTPPVLYRPWTPPPASDQHSQALVMSSPRPVPGQYPQAQIPQTSAPLAPVQSDPPKSPYRRPLPSIPTLPPLSAAPLPVVPSAAYSSATPFARAVTYSGRCPLPTIPALSPLPAAPLPIFAYSPATPAAPVVTYSATIRFGEATPLLTASKFFHQVKEFVFSGWR